MLAGYLLVSNHGCHVLLERYNRSKKLVTSRREPYNTAILVRSPSCIKVIYYTKEIGVESEPSLDIARDGMHLLH